MCVKQTYRQSPFFQKLFFSEKIKAHKTLLFLLCLLIVETQLIAQKLPLKATDSAELAKIWFDKAETKYKLRNYAEAISDYDQAIILMPNHIFAYNQRGNAQYCLGRYKEAVANFDTAIHLNPTYAVVFNSRGVAKRNLGLFKEAIADYDQAILLKPDYAIAFSSRGIAKVALKQYASALSDYDKAIELTPDYAKAYANKGCCLVAMNDKKRLNDAIKCLDKALIMDGLLNYARDCRQEAVNKLKE